MDTDRFEMFLRGTKFSESILDELWIEMSVLEKIDFMLYCRQSSAYLPDTTLSKALFDSSSLVRMLASSDCYHGGLESELFNRLNKDEHPFVRATTKEVMAYNFEGFIEIPHEERLALIALRKTLSNGKEFAEFIVTNLNNKSLSEKEAMELVDEYMSNPAVAEYVGDDSNDLNGWDFHHRYRTFIAIWELTILTPPQVCESIIWKYPLMSCDHDTIPDNVITKMDVEILSKLVWRGYQPLINNIKKNPEAFDEKLIKAVSNSEN